MSQDRLHGILAAAVEAAASHPDWREDSDQLCIVLDDAESTVLSTRGTFGTTAALAELLEFHARKLRGAP